MFLRSVYPLSNEHFAMFIVCVLLPYISDNQGNIPVKKDNLLKVFSDWGPDFHIMFDVQITSDDWDSSDIGLRNVLQFTRYGHFLMFYFRFYWLALQKLFEKTPLLFSSLLKTSLLNHWTSCATSITLQASCFENWFPCFARVLNSSRGFLEPVGPIALQWPGPQELEQPKVI